ncbi:Ig-like domain-containing protein [Mycobacterium sp. NPDC003323]
MTATLWGLTLVGPEIAVAAADDGVSSSSSSTGGADSSDSGNAGPSADEGSSSGGDDDRTAAPGSGTAQTDDESDDESDAPSVSKDDEDEDGDEGGIAEPESRLATASTDPTPRRYAAAPADRTEDIDTEAQPHATVSDAAADPQPEPAALATAPPAEPVPAPSDVETVTPTHNAVVALNRPSFGRQLVANQISALMGTGRTLISILPVANPVKDWLNDSLNGTRRTLFNQAPWLSPFQVNAQGSVPIVGSLGAVDLEGDVIRYKVVTAPLSGTLIIEDDGTFTYTPHEGFTGVDNFVISASDLGNHINLLDPFRSASTRASLLVNQNAVTFVFNYTRGSQYWTPEARSALQRAANNLMGQFIVTTPVVIDYDIIGENSFDTDNLASAGSPLIGSGAGFFPTVVQHKLLTGADANGAAADGEINWNFAYPWAFGDFVSSFQYDFTTVAMHEFMHSLGFMSYAQPSEAGTQRRWTLYDKFLRTADDTSLIGTDFRMDPALAASLTGALGGLYFGGAGAVGAYGTLVPLYAPSSWVEGSSVSHLDSTVFTGSNRQLMNPQVPTGTGVRALSDIERAIMEDLGYTLAPINVTSALALVGFVFLRRRRTLD